MKHGLPFATAGQVVGLLGGSFDPPHEGHAHISREALKRLRLDQLWWLVTPGNPLKSRPSAPLEQRITAARARIHHPKLRITDLESRLGTRFTYATARRLRRLYPRVHFVWLMGADNLAQFHRWERWQELLHTWPIAVFARPNAGTRACFAPATRLLRQRPLKRTKRLGHHTPPAWALVRAPLHKASSSQIRKKALRQ